MGKPKKIAFKLTAMITSALFPLFADVGIPMISLTFPLMLMLLIPVIAIEGFLYRRWLGLTTKEAMKASALSNLASTVIGVPIAWGIMLAAEYRMLGLVDSTSLVHNWQSPIGKLIFLLLGSAWIPPVNGRSAWLVPAATLVLLAPFFFASYLIEYRISRNIVGIPDTDAG